MDRPPGNLLRKLGSDPRLPLIVLGLLILASAIVVMSAGRGTVFRGDDWTLLLYRGGFSPDVFLVPHNEHLAALLIAAFKTIGAVVGPHYAAFRIALLATNIVVAILLFVFVRQRLGSWLALAAVAPVLFMGAGSDNLLWPTMIGIVASMACGIGVLLLLDRRSNLTNVAVCLLLFCAIAFSSHGLFFLAATAIWIVLTRSRWRDAWIFILPALAYAAWHTEYATPQAGSASVSQTLEFVAKSGLAGLSGVSGFGFHTASVVTGAVCLAIVLVIAVPLVRGQKLKVTPRMVAIVALPFISWFVIGAGRADGGDPYASRYVYASAIFILMAVAELFRDMNVPSRLGVWRGAAVAVIVVLAVSFNTQELFTAGDYWRSVSQKVRGRTAAVDLTRRTVDPDLSLEPLEDMGHMTAGWYLNSADSFGELPTGPPQIETLDAQGRRAADQVLAAGAPAMLIPPPPKSVATGPPPDLEDAAGRATRAGSCLAFPRTSLPAAFAVPEDGLLLIPRGKGGVEVQLRRYSADYLEAPALAADGRSLLIVAEDHSDVPWHAQISSQVPLKVCGTTTSRALRLGPKRPAEGNQLCEPRSIGETECRFRRF